MKETQKVFIQKEEYTDADQEGEAFDEQRIKVSVKVDWPYWRGGYYSVIAMKSPESFLLVAGNKYLILKENGKEVCSLQLKVDLSDVKEIAYINHLDCYLMLQERTPKLYRKDINDQDYYLFMEIRGGRPAYLGYSRLNKKLIMIDYHSGNTSVVNLERKQIEIKVHPQHPAEEYYRFAVFGELEDRLMALNNHGMVFQCVFNYPMKRIRSVNQLQLKRKRNIGEKFYRMALCDKGQLGFLSTSTNNGRPSRVIVLKIYPQKFEQLASIDQNGGNPKCISLLEPCGYFGGHALFFGLCPAGICSIQLYDFDPQTNQLRELEENRRNHRVFDPSKLCRFQNKFYYVGCEKLMKLTIKF